METIRQNSLAEIKPSETFESGDGKRKDGLRSRNPSHLIYGYVLGKIRYLESIADQGSGKAALAHLRRGAGKEPGELLEVWGLIQEDLPEELVGYGTKPSAAENAVYYALTLYALSQQGNEKTAQTEKTSIGAAAAKIVDPSEESSKDRVLSRLKNAASAQNQKSLAIHLRGLIKLLGSTPLDFGQLAVDIYGYNWPERRKGIRLKWARDFYSVLNRKPDSFDSADTDENK